jgi:hypothetical protein
MRKITSNLKRFSVTMKLLVEHGNDHLTADGTISPKISMATTDIRTAT